MSLLRKHYSQNEIDELVKNSPKVRALNPNSLSQGSEILIDASLEPYFKDLNSDLGKEIKRKEVKVIIKK